MKKSAVIPGVLCVLVMVLAAAGCKQASGGGETPPAPTYTVTFDSQGGSTVAPVTGVANGAKIAKPAADPTKDGYAFTGWYKEAACTNAWDFAVDTVTANITLYAKWIVYTVGDTGPAGGLIFYVNPTAAADGWTYLEAAPADLTGTYSWGAFGTYVNGTETGVGKGKANTAVIVAALAALNPPETGKAAQAADAYSLSGYDDWFLPSKDELNLMYTNLHVNGKGSFGTGYYWSSSQYDTYNTFIWSFSAGSLYIEGKSLSFSARPIRAF